MLSTTQKSQFRIRLESERARLKQWLADLESGVAPIDNPDEEDLADLQADQERRGCIESFDYDALVQVERALERLENGTYGVCMRCGEVIAAERLDALPYAELCLWCQARAEHNRR